MYKVVLILTLGLLSFNNVTSTSPELEPETEELREWVYWNAFSNTFNETADYWEAESAALEAERVAEERTDIEEFLHDVNLKEAKQDICKL